MPPQIGAVANSSPSEGNESISFKNPSFGTNRIELLNLKGMAGPAPVESGFARIVFTPIVGERYLIKAQNADSTSFGCGFTYTAVFRVYVPLVRG